MTSNEIKSNLQKLISETNDISILSRLQAYFDQLKQEKTDWWDDLNLHHQESILKGIEQLDNKKGNAHKEVRSRIDQILKGE